MKTFTVECVGQKGPCYSETVEAPDAMTARKAVAARAKANGFNPTSFKSIEVTPAKNPVPAQ